MYQRFAVIDVQVFFTFLPCSQPELVLADQPKSVCRVRGQQPFNASCTSPPAPLATTARLWKVVDVHEACGMSAFHGVKGEQWKARHVKRNSHARHFPILLSHHPSLLLASNSLSATFNFPSMICHTNNPFICTVRRRKEIMKVCVEKQ